MERLILAGLSVLTLNLTLVPNATATGVVSNHPITAEQTTTTFDTRVQGKVAPPEKDGAKPPSGDSNPSDRNNSTVNDRDIIDPQPN